MINKIDNEELKKMFFEAFTGTQAVDTNFKWVLFQKITSLKENESKNYCVESVFSTRGYISTARNIDCLADKETYNVILKETISKMPDAMERSMNESRQSKHYTV